MSARGDATQLKNYWYIAAPAAELRSLPLARTLLGERLVLFRQRDGHTWLLPRNSAFEPILGDEATVLGKVVTILRAV